MVKSFQAISVLVLLAPSATATQAGEVRLPTKTEWRLANGAVLKGDPSGFRREVLCLQRRSGKLLVNGEKLADTATLDLVRALGDYYAVPVNEPRALQKYLASQPGAQAQLPYFALMYLSDSGEEAIPVILLDSSEVALLKPAFDSWCLVQEEIERRRMKDFVDYQNQKAALELQAEAVRAQQSIEQASWAQAAAMRQAAFAAQVGAFGQAQAAAAAQAGAWAQHRGADAQERQAWAQEREADAIERIDRRQRLGL